MAFERRRLRPGDHVLAWGIGWVNIMPADIDAGPGEVYVRLGDNSTRRMEEHALELLDW